MSQDKLALALSILHMVPLNSTVTRHPFYTDRLAIRDLERPEGVAPSRTGWKPAMLAVEHQGREIVYY